MRNLWSWENPLHGVERYHHRQCQWHTCAWIHYMELKVSTSSPVFSLTLANTRIHYMELKVPLQGGENGEGMGEESITWSWKFLRQTRLPGICYDRESITWSWKAYTCRECQMSKAYENPLHGVERKPARPGGRHPLLGIRIHYMELKVFPSGRVVGDVDRGIHYMELKEGWVRPSTHLPPLPNPLHGVER